MYSAPSWGLPRWLLLTTGVLAAAFAAPPGRAAQVAGGTFTPVIDELAGRTLFAFDDVSIPFTRSLKLEMHAPEKYAGNPVVPRGQPGEPDAWAVQFYGSIIRVGDKFRMWYAALGGERGESTEHNSSYWRPAYAESDDGIHWVKPRLGLVEYRGSRENNLLAFDPFLGPINVKVLYEPGDPDPSRRYKMIAHVYWMKGDKRHGTLAPYASADGLRWKSLIDMKPTNAEMPADKLVIPPMHFEPAGGLYKWDGMYYSSGQNPFDGTRPTHARIVRGFRSRDFVEWSQTSNVGFVRAAQHRPLDNGNDGNQTHEGVSVWHRRNVLVGLYGMWQGSAKWPEITINLGFVVSNDGVHFREPAEDWPMIRIGPDDAWDQGGLIQGQGFENVGDKTYIYYGAWDPRTWTAYQKPIPPRGGVGLATLPRDRFGDLRVRDYGEGASEFITTSLAGKAGQRLYLNADGLGADAALKIEVLTHDERPLPGYAGADAAIVRQSGFQIPVRWKGGDTLRNLPERFRLKVTFEGARQQDIRFSALYVQNAAGTR